MYRTALAVLMVLRCSLLFGQSPADPPVSKGDQSRAEAEVRQLFEDSARNRSKPDAKELERLYADEFTSTNASGQVLNRDAVIAAKVSGRLSFQSTTLDELTIRIYGDVAVVRTSERIEGLRRVGGSATCEFS
jgi:hypothetical protein